MRIPTVTALLCLVLAGCHGIDLGDNPRHEVPKQAGPLTAPPLHLQNGGTE